MIVVALGAAVSAVLKFMRPEYVLIAIVVVVAAYIVSRGKAKSK